MLYVSVAGGTVVVTNRPDEVQVRAIDKGDREGGVTITALGDNGNEVVHTEMSQAQMLHLLKSLRPFLINYLLSED